MLTGWRETCFKPEEQILGLIFDGGMLMRTHIQGLMNLSYRSFRHYIWKINRMKKIPLIRRLHVPISHSHASKVVAYSLSREGVRYVYGMMGLQGVRVQAVPDGQMMHYLGLNDIALRVVQNYERRDIKWLSTRESAEDLMIWRKYRTGRSANHNIIPDATLLIRHPFQKVLIEFDNETESTAKLEAKFLAYRNLFLETQTASETDNLPPILWITRGEYRREYMERVWSAMLKVDSSRSYPLMKFFTSGQEIQWLKAGDSTLKILF